ncbi:hypothetical protein WA026_003888 [Henosepilachna vigintioctopunctata]|uniref:Uncharacterized protein n=1 Tax=Henosepilachna vigintioctopunctata TaxID=420089 RepID=A0AAW1UI65_9CUCU
MDRADSELKMDDSVKELENLKNSLGRTLSLMKTQTEHYSNVNGKMENHGTDIEEVKQNGKLVAKLFQQMDTDPEAPDKGGQPPTRVRTELEVPSEGIRKSVVQHLPADYPGLTENGNRKSSNPGPFPELRNNAEKTNSLVNEASQYTPLDMAEYVFWTGDEKSVSLAIEEFLQEGMMTREEAILFLQEIKYNLEYMKNHYIQYGLNPKEQHPMDKEKQEGSYRVSRRNDGPQEKTVGEQIRTELNQLRQLQEAYNKRKGQREAATLYRTGFNHGKTSTVDEKPSTSEDYEELLERLRLADFLYTEYSLEEVIYQLAKAMFTQSLKGGSAEAQQALTKFINFLEKEAEEGHISRSLEKKVLDVLIASLTDTLGEYPELLNTRQGIPKTTEESGQQTMRQFLELSPQDKEVLQEAIDPLVAIHKEQTNGRNQMKNNSPNKEQNMKSHISYGLGK